MGAVAALSAQSIPPFGVSNAGEPELTKYPYVQNTTATGSTILWATAESGTAAAEFSSDGRRFARVPATSRRFTREETHLQAPFTLHRADFAGLTANTLYYYRVSINNVQLAQGRFRTAGAGPFTFNVMGDSGERRVPPPRGRHRLLPRQPPGLPTEPL
jgi:hypothetical protein